jgi:GDP-L-fucose synthase
VTVDRAARTYVAGHRGLAGSAVWRQLAGAGFTDLIGRTSAELDLRDREPVFAFFRANRPRTVVLAAARVGGIGANTAEPVDFLSDNLRIQVNVLDAALATGVERLLFLGSSCIYPKLAPQPIREESLLTGALEPTNDAYAIAKITGVLHVRAARRQHGVHWVSAMPTNLYGPGDSFDPLRSHVLPGLLRRIALAAAENAPDVVVWGTGTPRREFLHVDDLARACLLVLDRYDDPEPINIGGGAEVTIRELAETISRVVGYRGRLVFDRSKPDGTPRKLLDASRLAALGFAPAVGLEDGIRSTYAWWCTSAGVERLHTSPVVPAGSHR